MKYIAVSAYCDIKKIAKAAVKIRKKTNTLRSISFPPKHPIFERKIMAANELGPKKIVAVKKHRGESCDPPRHGC